LIGHHLFDRAIRLSGREAYPRPINCNDPEPPLESLLVAEQSFDPGTGESVEIDDRSR
jgi:hypothetical protein